MRNGWQIYLLMCGLLGCSGKHLLVGEDGAGGAAGIVGAAAGAGGSLTASGGTTGTASDAGSACSGSVSQAIMILY